jgi:SAM-dependent methyltransferase
LRPELSPCPVCGSTGGTPVLELGAVPVFCNVLWDTREQARAAARGDIALQFCGSCGMLHNGAFDDELVRYSPAYENSLHFSSVFRRFADELAKGLVERHDLHGKLIVDIGCGNGDFLRMLCGANGNRGLGFDPSYRGEANGSGTITIVPELFSAERAAEPADFICCRHVLEHLQEPRALLETLAGTPAALYFEVPDGEYMLREAAVWDVIYEHASYFTPAALARLFEDLGFGALDVGSTFGGQYLYIETSSRTPANRRSSPAELSALVERFAKRGGERVATWSDRLRELHDAGRGVALWGAGSKGVTFLNIVSGGEEIELVIDLNERKHGRHVPGTGQTIQPPDALSRRSPEVVLAMNPLYVDEIRAALCKLGVNADVVAV